MSGDVRAVFIAELRSTWSVAKTRRWRTPAAVEYGPDGKAVPCRAGCPDYTGVRKAGPHDEFDQSGAIRRRPPPSESPARRR